MFYSDQNPFSLLTFLRGHSLSSTLNPIVLGRIEPTFSLGVDGNPNLANHSIRAITQ